MRPPLLLIALALVAVPGCKKDSQEPRAPVAPTPLMAAEPAITFGQKGPPAVGRKYLYESRTNLQMQAVTNARGEKIDGAMTSTETAKYNVEVLAANADAPTQLKVIYVEKATVDTEDGEAKPSLAHPVVGKEYRVSLAKDEITVTSPKGGKVSQEEADLVTDD